MIRIISLLLLCASMSGAQAMFFRSAKNVTKAERFTQALAKMKNATARQAEIAKQAKSAPKPAPTIGTTVPMLISGGAMFMLLERNPFYFLPGFDKKLLCKPGKGYLEKRT